MNYSHMEHYFVDSLFSSYRVKGLYIKARGLSTKIVVDWAVVLEKPE